MEPTTSTEDQPIYRGTERSSGDPLRIPQVDYRANPSFAGDSHQGVDSYEEPNAAPAVFVSLPPPPPDQDIRMDERPMVPGYVQEGFGLEIQPSVREQLARHSPDVAHRGYSTW